MNTDKPPETKATRDASASTPKSVHANSKSKMVRFDFPRDASPKQIADSLNELRRQHLPKR
jgi:hypothetical protein